MKLWPVQQLQLLHDIVLDFHTNTVKVRSGIKIALSNVCPYLRFSETVLALL